MPPGHVKVITDMHKGRMSVTVHEKGGKIISQSNTKLAKMKFGFIARQCFEGYESPPILLNGADDYCLTKITDT